MPFETWGAATDWGLNGPGDAVSLALIVLLAVLNLVLLVHYHRAFGRMTAAQWVGTAALAAAGFVCSWLFPLPTPWQDPALSGQPMLTTVNLLSAVPILLAGVMFNPGAALIVGLVTGLGHGLSQTHSLFDIFNYGLGAWLAGVLLGQVFAGRFFGAMRWPIVGGPVALGSMGLLVGLEVFARLMVPAGVLAALDMAQFVGAYAFLVLMVEGFAGGALVSALVLLLPQIRGARGRAPSPFGRGLQNYMTASFFSFTVLLLLLSAGAVFALSTRTMSRALVEQMAYGVDATAARLPILQGELTNDLAQYGQDDRLLDSNMVESDKALNQLSRTAPEFRQVLLVSANGQVRDGSGLFTDLAAGLSVGEQAAVSTVLATGQTQIVGDNKAGAAIFSLVVPVQQDGERTSVLVGRVAESGLNRLFLGLSGVSSLGKGFLVDAESNVVMSDGVGRAPAAWQPPLEGQRKLSVPPAALGVAYEAISPGTGGRELVYYAAVPGSNWLVVATVPQSVILRQVLEVIAPFVLLLLLFSILFFVNVSAFGRSVSRPISELVVASQAIAKGGGLEETVRVQRQDELGKLSASFGEMQRALKKRLDELNLLLTVSNEVAASNNLSQGMPAVLQGVLRGTEAVAARAIVRNPSANEPLIYAEGSTAALLAPLDRKVMTEIRTVTEIALANPEEIAARLGQAPDGIKAIFAVPLRSATEFQGVLYLGYRKPHAVNGTESNLLHTLAGQAAVLVHNAHLFSAVESGRQRLAAILASTSNAVIVTDQTDRVLLTNPATEKAFGLRTLEIVGRPVRDVIRPQALADRLSLRGGAVNPPPMPGGIGSVEIEMNGRTFVANIATVYSAAGISLGRVAVLHDVTDFKDLDRMKSDFLAGVSHDLLSPLTYMRNFSSMLPIPEDTRLEQEYIHKILGGIDRMTAVINDLLDLARIEAGIALEVRPIPLGQLLLDVAQEHWSHARAVGVTIRSHVTGTPVAQGDPVLLRRALNNLVLNAIKYAPHSGDLLLHAAAVNNELVISVHDHGPGIPADELPHLFESFYRGKKHLHDNTRGSGLGLAIVKSIAELHGGRVSCDSSAEEGTRFIIWLPADPRRIKQRPGRTA